MAIGLGIGNGIPSGILNSNAAGSLIPYTASSIMR